MSTLTKRAVPNPKARLIAAGIALAFGIVTIISGGQALFGSEAARAAVGDAVPFVLWFNFIAGFAYIVAAVGLFKRLQWSWWLSALIAISTVLVSAALGVHIWSAGSYEARTVGAMALRSGIWIAIAVIAWRALCHSNDR